MTKNTSFRLNPELKATVMGVADPGDLAKVREFCHRFYAQDPTNIDAVNALATLNFRDGQLDRAAEGFHYVLERLDADDPDAIDVHRALMLCFYNSEKLPEAAAHAARIIERVPSETKAYEVLCLAHYRLQELDKVSMYLGQAQMDAAPMIHFQPRLRPDTPPVIEQEIAKSLEAAWRNQRLGARYREAAAATWTPGEIGERVATLRGATSGVGPDAKVTFLVAPADRKAAKEKSWAAAVRPPSDGKDGGVLFWQAEATGLQPGTRYRCRLRVAVGKRPVMGGAVEFKTRLDGTAHTLTGAATVVGRDCATLHGSVAGTTQPTTYRFQYGVDPARLDRETRPAPVPPARSARVRDLAAHVQNRLSIFGLRKQFVASSSGGEPDDAGADFSSDYAVRIQTPFGKDRNHLEGVGVVDLAFGWWSVLEPDPKRAEKAEGLPSDLRDAVLSVRLRGEIFDPQDFHLFANCQTFLPPDAESASDVRFRCESWCLTGQPTPKNVLTDGDWHQLTYNLVNDMDAWSFGANNVKEQGTHADRYAYMPLSDMLSRHRSNLCFLFLFGDGRKTPKGAIDVHDIGLRCRNWSLLAPGSPARLLSWPAGSMTDPGRLTKGWIANLDRMWFSGPGPQTPQEFIWDLGGAAQLDAVRLFNNVTRPSRDVELSVSLDGKSFKRCFEAELAEGDLNAHEGAATVAAFDAPLAARFLKLTVHSGYRDDFWGLDAIEAFGNGPPPSPELDPATLSHEIRGLDPGSTVHYRLVTENQAGRAEGEVRAITLPETAAPLLHHARVLEADGDKVTLMVRLTAMGHDTKLACRVENAQGKVVFDGPAIAAGNQLTPRDITYVVPKTGGGTRWTATLTARNAAGESEPSTVAWK